LLIDAFLQPLAHEHAGKEHILRIGKHGPQSD
jgi:hypothetical protein